MSCLLGLAAQTASALISCSTTCPSRPGGLDYDRADSWEAAPSALLIAAAHVPAPPIRSSLPMSEKVTHNLVVLVGQART